LFGIITVLFSFAVTSQASVVGFSDHALWATAAGTTALENFDSLPAGVVTSLPSINVTSMSGLNASNVAVNQTITSQFSLPFPMFTAGNLPSSPNFISNNMSAASGFATGSLTFIFASGQTAVGAFVADSSPLGGFSIEVFNGTTSLGLINVGNRTLPDSFVGIVSTTPFTSAKFAALNANDSWGLDNVEVSTSAAAVPEPGTVATMLTGLVGILMIAAQKRASARLI